MEKRHDVNTEFGISEVARLTGTTSRALRHYHSVGLLAPSRVGHNGYRFYDTEALMRLQRILLLRQMGLGIPAIGEVLAGHIDDGTALRSHLVWLRQEQARLDHQIVSVEHTIQQVENGGEPMPERMFDGFDHTRFQHEVTQRWGADTYLMSDGGWRGLGQDGQKTFMAESAAIVTSWAAARDAGLDPVGPPAQALARRHYEWIVAGWGGTRPSVEQLLGLADMYVVDERFAAHYGGSEGAAYVRQALLAFAETL